MSRQRETHEDAFNMMCGKQLGEGVHRFVFECKIRPDLVVKVEKNDHYRFFANAFEMAFWSDFPKVQKWLAPCEFLSPNGRVLLQKHARPIHDDDVLPDELPTFLRDVKRENFGFIGDQLVCVDYVFTKCIASTTMRKVKW